LTWRSGASVRRVKAGEWRRLRDLRLRALAETPDAFGSTHAGESAQPDAFWQERATAAAQGQERLTMIAEMDHGWVGLAGGYTEAEEPDRPWLVSVWVDPAWRGKGLGDKLVNTVIAWATSRNAVGLQLDVAESNQAAIRLYERCGFVATGKKVPMERDPTILEDEMVLDLRP
jgi:ribosomal protein S18 acetylase RimI-like enzyme